MEPSKYNLHTFSPFFENFKLPSCMHEECVHVFVPPSLESSIFALNIQTYERNVPLAAIHLN